MSTILNYFRSIYNDYEALQKKDDDLYFRALENWNAKYKIDNIDSAEKVELMVTELLQIPTEVLTISDINEIGNVFHRVALKRKLYKEIFIQMLKNNSGLVVQTWLDRVCTALPIKN